MLDLMSMCITYSVLSCELATSFSIFQFSFFQVKMVNHCEDYISFQILNINFKQISFITFFITTFYKTFIRLAIYLIHLKFFTGNFCDIAYPYKLFTFQH